MWGSLRRSLGQVWRRPFLGLLGLLLLVVIGWGGSVAFGYAWAQYHYYAAERALANREFAAAQAHLARCLQVWDESADTYLLAARTARRAASYEEAAKLLKRYQQLGGIPEEIDLERDLGRAQQGNLAEVEGRLLEFVRLSHPYQVLILEALARGYLKTYQLPQAQYCLTQWLEREPNEIQALLWLGEVQERRQSFDDALQAYRRAASLAPERDDVRLRLAEMLVHAHQTEEAQAELERLRERQPGNRSVLLGLARCRHLAGDLTAASHMLDDLLATAPQDAEILSERGRVAQEAGQPEEAERFLRNAVAVAPYDRETAYTLYQCLERQKKTAEAQAVKAKLDEVETQLTRLAELTRQIGDRPHDASLRYEAGMIFFRSGQPKEGVRWLLSALQEDPRFAPAHRSLAEYYQSIGDQHRAQLHQEQAR